MAKSEYTTVDGVIYLCSCAVNGSVPDKELISGISFDALYKAAEMHSLTSAVAMSLEKIGIKTDKFEKARGNAIRKAVLSEAEKAAVFSELEKAGIWYLPLKGAIIKDMYPSVGMRQMADFDVYFDADKSDIVKKIMLERGYTADTVGVGTHDSYHKAPFYNFEFHRILFMRRVNPVFYDYFGKTAERQIKDENNSFGYHLSDEDFYIYLIAHEYKHFSRCGTGLRSLLDTYVYLKNRTNLRAEYLAAEFEKLGLTEFERQNKNLAFHLFDGDELTEEDREMLNVFLRSGTYGTTQNGVNRRVNEFGGGFKGKISYFFKRIFLPMETVKDMYPFFYRHKILLPFLFPYRIVVSHGKHKGKIRSELSALTKKQKKSPTPSDTNKK